MIRLGAVPHVSNYVTRAALVILVIHCSMHIPGPPFSQLLLPPKFNNYYIVQKLFSFFLFTFRDNGEKLVGRLLEAKTSEIYKSRLRKDQKGKDGSRAGETHGSTSVQ